MRATKINRHFFAGLGLSVILAFAGSSLSKAQEISEAHQAAARAAIDLIRSSAIYLLN